jgi:hypothetical protein
MALRAGDWIEVKSKDEILATLDKNGRLEQMPFMPQMFQYCGKRFMVQKRAHKTCDPIYTMAARSVDDSVHLNLRCDGKTYGGCQAGCLLFWKEAWLKPVAAEAAASTKARLSGAAGCTEADVKRATRVEALPGEDGADIRYVCQTTQLPEFTKPLRWWNPAQYLEDYRSGNVSLTDLVHGALYVLIGRRGGRRIPLLRHFHDVLQSFIGGSPSPVRNGAIPLGAPVPTMTLGLRAGELVRVKSHEEILTTINEHNWHRGLYFDVEMVPYCGRVFRVKARVEKFLDEKTGRMRQIKSPAVILDGVSCKSQFSRCRMHCPRSIYSWWREEWLERVEELGTERSADIQSAVPRPPAPRRTLETAQR